MNAIYEQAKDMTTDIVVGCNFGNFASLQMMVEWQTPLYLGVLT